MNNGYGQVGSMLAFARQTCAHVGEVECTQSPNASIQEQLFPEAPDLVGEYAPDPEQVAAWQNEGQERPVYNGEWRYINLGPAKVRQLLAVETDPEEIAALQTAERYWMANKGYGPDELADWVHPMQEEPREAIHTTMREMHANLNPVRWEPESMGSLIAVGNGPRCGPEESPEMGIFEELTPVLNSGESVEQIYFEASGWVPSCDGNHELDLCLQYDVDEVVSY